MPGNTAQVVIEQSKRAKQRRRNWKAVQPDQAAGRATAQATGGAAAEPWYGWDCCQLRCEVNAYKAMASEKEPAWSRLANHRTDTGTVVGLTRFSEKDSFGATVIKKAFDSARVMAECALRGIAAVDLNRSDEQLKLNRLFGPIPNERYAQMLTELVHQIGFLLHGIRRIEKSNYKTIGVVHRRALTIGLVSPALGLMMVNWPVFQKQNNAIRCWVILHELVHLILGGKDHFYLDAIERIIPLIEKIDAALTENAMFLSAGSESMPWLLKRQPDEDSLLAITGTATLREAVAKFLYRSEERVELLLHHPDTLALAIFLFARSDLHVMHSGNQG